jgi:hypothetical protein
MTDSTFDDDITVIRSEGSAGGVETPVAGWKGTIAVDMDDVLWCVGPDGGLSMEESLTK